MLERLVAGVVVIGVLLWAASSLATPGEPPTVHDDAGPGPDTDAPQAPDAPDAPAADPSAPGGARDTSDDGDDEQDRDEERRGKRKRGPGGDA